MIINRFEEIFAGFLNREYNFELTNEQLMFEINVLRPCRDREDYLRVNRKGGTLVLNRQKRNAIWGLWVNAARHFQFEVEMYEAEVC